MNNNMDKDGIPHAYVGTQKLVLFTPKGTVINQSSLAFEKQTISYADQKFKHNNVEYVSWGDTNQLPEQYLDLISKTGVLQTAINYKASCAIGNGIVPVIVDGYNNDLSEILKPLNNREVIDIINSVQVERSISNSFRDLYKFGNVFSVFLFDADGSKIIRTETLNARHCRISVDKTKLIYSAGFVEKGSPDKDAQVFDMLSESDPLRDLEERKKDAKKALAGKKIAFPRIKNYLSNNDYYAAPDWYAAALAGWINVAHTIPVFLQKMYENALTIRWHIQIPYAYFDKAFPKESYQSVEERFNAIKEFENTIEKSLIGVDNANKALFSRFSINESGKAEEQWIIDPLKNKIEADDKLTLSAAANSEILFSLMVNPSVLGAGMPGGPYSGNAGSGSDIREGFLVSMILSSIERTQLLYPIEYMLRFNGYGNVDLRFKQIQLTTLDKGKHTEVSVS